MKVNRKELLRELQTVEIGLSPEETVSQSDCFVFKDGEVMTYNNKVACHYKCSLNITGAVNASKLLKMVARSNDEEIEFEVGKGKLNYKGKAKKGYIRMDKDILLPISDVKTPKKWVSLSKEVIEAIHQVSNCAALSQKVPHFACVNIAPNLVEACDGYQAGRVEIKTPFKKSTLIRATTLRNILKLNVSHVGLINNWIHFKNKDGLIISTLIEIGKYPTDELTKIFDIKGSPAKLSTGLKELVNRVSVYLEDDEEVYLTVKIEKTFMEVRGHGELGEQRERKKIKYKGKPIEFRITPSLLQDFTQRSGKCIISEKAIKIERGNFQYITNVWMPEKDKKE